VALARTALSAEKHTVRPPDPCGQQNGLTGVLAGQAVSVEVIRR